MHRQTLRTAWTGKPAVDRTVPYDHDRGADARKPGIITPDSYNARDA